MKNFFKPEDFQYVKDNHISRVSIQEIVDIANHILNAEIDKWPVVYAKSYDGTDISYWHEDGGGTINVMKTARLAFIEEISKKECLHEPETAMMCGPQGYTESVAIDKCKHCGKKLKATWSVDE